MKTTPYTRKKEVVILFAGDSGDGIQLTGGQFTETSEIYGNDVSTFPNFPSDIRAPQGTLSGVSGFQLKMGSVEVFTPGDQYDVLVVMNAAALKVSLSNLKPGGIIIANTSGFDNRNLKLAKFIDQENPLTDNTLAEYDVHQIDVTKMTREALKDTSLGKKEIDRCKNMFVLGYIYWMFNREPGNTIQFLRNKFVKKAELADANIHVLLSGYHFGETRETFTTRFNVEPARLPKGNYRNINGNQAVALALIAAAKRNNLELFYGSYPITPASDILHELSKHKNFGVKTYQAEDEIAAMCSVVGASYAGSLSATATSGPGLSLKTEAMGLAVMLELPMVIVNVQRGGPSTGLPTKTEQADLFQALYSRHGEAPMPVLAAVSPEDTFSTVYEAARIALEHMTPVMVLSDGYIAQGAEPWRYPKSDDLARFNIPYAKHREEETFLPYSRDERQVRKWATAGSPGLAHRVGGLEKEIDTGDVSYDAENHEKMVLIREQKVNAVSRYIPQQIVNRGPANAEVLILGWGSTYGAIETAVRELLEEGYSVAHVHLRYLLPFPENLGILMSKARRIIVPEMNRGQLVKLVRERFLVPAEPLSKVKGMPFTVEEIKTAITKPSPHVYNN
jgi:2-oxoglutarate/2-oxoacid ferredoxin oxidoreductase subunit alpha